MTSSSDHLVIRLLERQDIEFARQLHNDDSVLLRLSDPSHVSEAQQEGWFESVSLSRSSRRYLVQERISGDPVGVFRVDSIDHYNRSVCIGLDITKEKRGRGYARESFLYFLDLFLNQQGYHRVYLATLETNKVALNLYHSLGFVEEGRSREAIFRDGRFQDLIWLSILGEEFRASPQPA